MIALWRAAPLLPLIERYRERGSRIERAWKKRGLICGVCLTPSCGCPPLPSPLSLSSHSFLLGHSDVIQRPPQEQLHSEPAFPPSLSLSLNLFLSFLCTSRGMQGEARRGRGGRSDTIEVFFCPEKKGAIASHLLLSPLYCTILQAGGWVQWHCVLVC